MYAYLWTPDGNVIVILITKLDNTTK